ncbi:hypothetical protein [Bordetella bronchialis]|nr:hypothetical protein [Bordetella bronchialis]
MPLETALSRLAASTKQEGVAMRETLDCGVLMVPAHAGWMDTWMQRHAGHMARVRLHAVDLDDGAPVVAANGAASAYAGAPAAAQSLARLAMSLCRFDACLLPVAPDTLGWTRTALSCARGGLRTPLIGLARGLKAAAVQDLLALGMCDFVRDPLCPEELRVRVDRVAGRRPGGSEAQAGLGAGGPPAGGEGYPPADGARPPQGYRGPLGAPAPLGHCVPEDAAMDPYRRAAVASAPGAVPGTAVGQAFQEPTTHYPNGDAGAWPVAAAATARRSLFHCEARAPRGDARPRLSREAIDSSLLAIQAAPRVHPDEPFRIAKSRVVDSFERDYVRTALSRHAGNVARAARASAKHRRAFWALMRKHHIDAAPYRPRQDYKNAGE